MPVLDALPDDAEVLLVLMVYELVWATGATEPADFKIVLAVVGTVRNEHVYFTVAAPNRYDKTAQEI
ncbi:MAG: hypothetical protein SEPTF4163_005729 [Sporothrix epigloea]